MSADLKKADRLVAMKIVAIYVFIGFLFISASDIILEELALTPSLLKRISFSKDILFILLTATLLNYLIKHYFRLTYLAEETKLQLESKVTALDQSESAQRDALKKLAIVVDGIPTLIAQVDLNQRYLYVNDNYAAWIGKGSDEIVGATVREILGEETYRTTVGCIGQVLNGQFTFLERNAGNQGEEQIQHMSFIPQHDELGAVTSYYVLINDITLIRQAELALLASEQKFRGVLENVRLATVIIENDNTISFCNDFLCEISGWTRDELMNRDWFESLVPEASREAARGAMALDAPTLHFEESLLTREGGVRRINWDMTSFYDADGCVTEKALIGVDITNQQAIEEQLRQTSKMEAIGTMASGVAHDFNNILTVIMGCADMMQNCNNCESHEPCHYSQIVLNSVNRAAALTTGLLAFSRKQEVRMGAIDLNSRVRQLEELFSRIIGEDISVNLSLCDGSLSVMADGGQLDQVVMNLVSNARDAMPQGGSLKISTYLAEHGLPASDGCYEHSPVPCAVLEVVDTGAGMGKATLDRIFDPFYTTKDVGKGTGLGLSIVYGIVKSHDGVIQVESSEGVGTSFRIYLPCIGLKPEKEKEQPVALFSVGNETILLVEDDLLLRQLVKSRLEYQGYTVIEASDGEEGVELFKNTLEPIHLVFTDVIMPRKNGIVMSREISALQPGIPIVFMSGYAADHIKQIRNAGQVAHFVPKPIVFGELLKTIRGALQSSTVIPAGKYKVADAGNGESYRYYPEAAGFGR